ncbi:helix-turn-helix domain-containing protein [uncultured Christiangramia sp.]|uniref:helix-turn-helix domain-containing protein n=1 Tax=uncultured Christiangramia sp. TaxID=503836 RepID=UPI002601C9D2|nr:helix-turn-helix domain-containing protein [uncultured Christiangramia sp.]
MNNVTQVHHTTTEKLQESILNGIKSQLEKLKKEYQPKEPEEYLSRAEVAKMLKVDISTIHNWSKSGRLKRYGIGNRVYFKRSDIERAIVQL